jgi:hypothetical protein
MMESGRWRPTCSGPTALPIRTKPTTQYVTTLKSLALGQLKLAVLTYDADPANGSIRRIKLQADFTTPNEFASIRH